jgi:hypothetical protein
MGPRSSNIHILESGLLEHEAMVLSFASRVAVQGDLEQLEDALFGAKNEVESNTIVIGGGSDGVVVLNRSGSKGNRDPHNTMKRNRHNKSNDNQQVNTSVTTGTSTISPLQKEASIHRTAIMGLAREIDHYRHCLDRLEVLEDSGTAHVEELIQNIQEGAIVVAVTVDGGRRGFDKDSVRFQIQMAEALGITLDRQYLGQEGGADDNGDDDGDDEDSAIIVGGGAGSSTSTSNLRCY